MKYPIKFNPIELVIETEGFDKSYSNVFETDDIDYIGDYKYGYPESIDNLLMTLELLKSKGATHVSMDYHEDHGSYMIEGLNIEIEENE